MKNQKIIGLYHEHSKFIKKRKPKNANPTFLIESTWLTNFRNCCADAFK